MCGCILPSIISSWTYYLKFISYKDMDKIETIEAFYKRKFDWIPDNIKNEIGHFNVFEHEHVEPRKTKPLPYNRGIFTKSCSWLATSPWIMLTAWLLWKKQAMFFSNPQIPYNCENLERITTGFNCISNSHFFHKFGDLNQYAVFQPAGNHVFELSDE